MLTAIEFHDQPLFEANEVDDIWTDDLLPAEFLTTELTIAQVLPEQPFCIGLIAAKISGEMQHLVPLTPALSRKGRGGSCQPSPDQVEREPCFSSALPLD